MGSSKVFLERVAGLHYLGNFSYYLVLEFEEQSF